MFPKDDPTHPPPSLHSGTSLPSIRDLFGIDKNDDLNSLARDHTSLGASRLRPNADYATTHDTQTRSEVPGRPLLSTGDASLPPLSVVLGFPSGPEREHHDGRQRLPLLGTSSSRSYAGHPSSSSRPVQPSEWTPRTTDDRKSATGDTGAPVQSLLGTTNSSSRFRVAGHEREVYFPQVSASTPLSSSSDRPTHSFDDWSRSPSQDSTSKHGQRALDTTFHRVGPSAAGHASASRTSSLHTPLTPTQHAYHPASGTAFRSSDPYPLRRPTSTHSTGSFASSNDTSPALSRRSPASAIDLLHPDLTTSTSWAGSHEASRPHQLRPSLSTPILRPPIASGNRTPQRQTPTAEEPASWDDRSVGKYSCDYCQKRFSRPSSLKIHVNTHTGAQPFRCPFPECGRKFSVMSNMRRHARVHTQYFMDMHEPEGGDGAESPGRGSVPLRGQSKRSKPPGGSAAAASSSRSRGVQQARRGSGSTSGSGGHAGEADILQDDELEDDDEELMDMDGPPPLGSSLGAPLLHPHIAAINDRYSRHTPPAPVLEVPEEPSPRHSRPPFPFPSSRSHRDV